MNHAINQLIQYGLDHGLIDPRDRYYVANTLIDLFSLSQYEEESIEPNSVCLQDVSRIRSRKKIYWIHGS